MNSKQVLLRIPNDLYYQITTYAEMERRSTNNAVEYILQKFFSENPVEFMESTGCQEKE